MDNKRCNMPLPVCVALYARYVSPSPRASFRAGARGAARSGATYGGALARARFRARAACIIIFAAARFISCMGS